MNLKEFRLLTISIYLLLIVGIFYPIISPYIEENQGEFISMTITNEDKKTSNYFRNNNSILYEDDENKWFITINNNVADLSYVSVKVKIMNFDEPSPDTIKCTPSDGYVIYQINKVIQGFDKITIPFYWKVMEVNDSNEISLININDNNININISLNDESNCKIMFELWKYDILSDDFDFGIEFDDNIICVWNQINFKINSN